MEEDDKQQVQIIQSKLSEYQHFAMKIINKRNTKNLITPDIFFGQYPRPDLSDEAYLKEIEYGYTNSSYFEHINILEKVKFDCIDKPVGIKPQKSYRLKENKSPSDAIQDILENSESLMIIDCQGAVIIAQYYAVLNVLKDFLGEVRSKALFDECFSMLPRLLISRYTAESGTSKWCISGDMLFAPLNPLAYFMMPHEGSAILGCHLYYQNHSDYLKKHPRGDWQGHAVVCVSTNPYRYIGFDLEKPFTEIELSQLLCKNYNKPSIQKQDDINVYYVDKIKPEDVPGFDVVQTRILSAQKILYLLKNPSDFIKQLRTFLTEEITKVNQSRIEEIKKRLNLTSSNYPTKIENPLAFFSSSPISIKKWDNDKNDRELMKKELKETEKLRRQ